MIRKNNNGTRPGNEIRVGFGIPKGQELGIAKMLSEAFENEFRSMFGSKSKAADLIAESLGQDTTVTTIREGKVVGVVGLRFEGKEFLRFGFWQLLRKLNWDIFRFMLIGGVFYTRVRRNELVIDMLAVDRHMRNKGIGSRLIGFVVEFARSKKFDHVRLHVKDNKDGAKRFYEKHGFEETQYRDIAPWSAVLGFEGAYEMKLDIDSEN